MNNYYPGYPCYPGYIDVRIVEGELKFPWSIFQLCIAVTNLNFLWLHVYAMNIYCPCLVINQYGYYVILLILLTAEDWWEL